jgi:hypothetical protein
MKFCTNAARYALWIGAAVAIAACSSQAQEGALPQAALSSTFDATQSVAHQSPEAGRRGQAVHPTDTFKFQTINNKTDKTFNQLLGINDTNTISGYYGSGMAGHPNKGYTVVPPYDQANFTAENVPGSAQTQVTCIDDLGNTGGFWVDSYGVNLGFIEWNGVFTSYKNPKTGKGTVNQILGLNDAGIAVGFYTDVNGVNHGYTLNQATAKFTAVKPPGGKNVTASAINNLNDVVGFYSSGSQTVGFIEKNGVFSSFSFPGSTNTTPFGVNDHDAIVGAYVDAKGATHGFLLETPLSKAKWTTVDDPDGAGGTTVNGINNSTKMVGFFVDGNGNTNGMLVTR